jgi:hypothetical protein
VKAEVVWNVGSKRRHDKDPCVAAEAFQKEMRAEVVIFLKPKLQRGWPSVTFMVILEKESSTRSSTRNLVLPKVPERRVAGSLNLWVTSKGTVCVLIFQCLLEVQRAYSAQVS